MRTSCELTYRKFSRLNLDGLTALHGSSTSCHSRDATYICAQRRQPTHSRYPETETMGHRQQKPLFSGLIQLSATEQMYESHQSSSKNSLSSPTSASRNFCTFWT